MAQEQTLTATQWTLNDMMQDNVEVTRNLGFDDGRMCTLDAVGAFSRCLTEQQLPREEMPPSSATRAFETGETVLQLIGERLLSLSGLPLPYDFAALAGKSSVLRISSLRKAFTAHEP